MAGPTRPKLKEVAITAGVSAATASLILNNAASASFRPETIARVRRAARKLGYSRSGQLLHDLAGKRVLFYTDTSQADRHFYAPSYHHLREACDACGCEIEATVGPEGGKGAAHIEAVFGRDRYAGVVFAGYVQEAHAWAVAQCVPAVLIGDAFTVTVPCAQVRANNFAGGHLAATALCRAGHRRIGFLGFRKSGMYYGTRLAGFRQGMAEAGVSVAAAWVHDECCPDQLVVDYLTDLAQADSLPTAFVAANLSVAAELLRWAGREEVAVPEALSLVSFDSPAGLLGWEERLATVETDLSQFGRLALRKLGMVVSGLADALTAELVTPVLCTRASLATPRQDASEQAQLLSAPESGTTCLSNVSQP